LAISRLFDDHIIAEISDLKSVQINNRFYVTPKILDNMTQPTLVSLYSGCGGSSKGFENAGFLVKYMNDNNPDAVDSLKENFPEAVIEKGNVRISRQIKTLWEEIPHFFT